MTIYKNIICFANSARKNGHCVVGREIFADGTIGEWIRPIGDRVGEELSDNECQYLGGDAARILDIMRIGLKCPKPNRHQRENWLNDDSIPWQKMGRRKYGEILPLLENGATNLWYRPNYDNVTDRVVEEIVDRIEHSVVLIQPDRFSVSFNEYFASGEVKRNPRRAKFTYQNTVFTLGCTDRSILWKEPSYLDQINQRSIKSPPILCISLGQVFNSFAYKIVAAVIFPNAKGE